MHKVFISYHHGNDQEYKEALLAMNGEGENRIFIDGSVDTGDISDDLSDEAIREKIRDEYLQDTTVTMVLVGIETWGRKHVDWEIYSSMFDGTVNKKSGILVVLLPPAYNGNYCHVTHDDEKQTIHPDITNWTTIDNRAEFERMFPFSPNRIIDNLLCKDAGISVVPWDKIYNKFSNLHFLINATHDDRINCKYDLKRGLRRQNV